MAETYAITIATHDEDALICAWVRRHPSTTMERLDAATINVYVEGVDLENELAETCDAYGIGCSLV